MLEFYDIDALKTSKMKYIAFVKRKNYADLPNFLYFPIPRSW